MDPPSSSCTGLPSELPGMLLFPPELLQALEPGSNSHVLRQLGKHRHPPGTSLHEKCCVNATWSAFLPRIPLGFSPSLFETRLSLKSCS